VEAFGFLGFILGLLLQLVLASIVYPLPMSDNREVRYKTIPWVTVIIIGINSLIFLFFTAPDQYAFNRLLYSLNAGQIVSEEQLYAEVGSAVQSVYNDYERTMLYGFRGVNVYGEGVSVGAITTFTAMFMHGDFLHLFFNMLVLWAFGRRVEDACGPWRYLLFYLTVGLVAHLGSDTLNPSKAFIPGIGASGAIFGVMGAYLLLFPGAKVRCLWGIGMVLRLVGFMFASEEDREWKWTIELPAFFVAGAMAVREVINSLQTIQQSQLEGGVNNIAHMAGLLGALTIFLFVRKDLFTRYMSGRRL
jgi:membrane associated rhomboid family serine protease